MTIKTNAGPGMVYLVGAGPGDARLLTLRAVECLEQADVVLYDYLVNPAALEHASPSADLVCLGHHGTGRALSPDQITARMLYESLRGRTVVRLKGGDPSVFGRGADETGALSDAGVPYEIVPGITAGFAAAAYCEIPVTHHDDASAVALVAGRERQSKDMPSLDYRALAAFPGTLILYMGVKRVAEWSGALVRHGRPPDTPVAIVRWCSRARQQTVRCTLQTVAEVVREQGILPPALFVVGKVVDRAPQLSWFAARPLTGARVLLAGSRGTSERLRDRLAALGADVLMQPVVRITDPPDWAPVDAALERLDAYDWLVFSSGNGVDYLVRRVFEHGGDVRRLGAVKLAAVGSGTAERLAQYHLQADFAFEQFSAESLAQALAGQPEGQRFLLAEAGRGWDVLVGKLEAAGSRVDQIAVYDRVELTAPNPDILAALSSGEVDWITVTSSATARSLVRLYGDALRSAQLASISPLTSSALRDEGYEPAAEAFPHTAAGLVDAIIAADKIAAGKTGAGKACAGSADDLRSGAAASPARSRLPDPLRARQRHSGV
jgi:uroporphyrinogen III methyltransferase/synthase